MVSNESLINQIQSIKRELGSRLMILGHHYQRREIVELSDLRGDSLGLSQQAAAQKEAAFIVFCGVYFMAETAEILSAPEQIVQIPEPDAGCPLSDFAPMGDIENAWSQMVALCGGERITPITYVNSQATLKAFCGRTNGAVCTSANVSRLFDWAFQRSEKVFFFPDQHLGRNTANRLGISPDQIVVWNPRLPLGGHTEAQLAKAKLILWNGYCHVHTKFTPEDVLRIRRDYPGAKVIVHPECPEKVVNLADQAGSTGFLVKFVREAPSGSTIAVGTELNLVSRLAVENPDKRVVELARSVCPNMYKTTLPKLLRTLESIGQVNVVKVPTEVAEQARIALQRMLTIG